ncbi:MAG: peptide/nickel transport system substrate-binding protein [Solirubrobacteraceae bacterium]|jgi:peptide/nickel transport system substrate-binding protein|nr:peptide/nickel transport system substrate-binding protein [Solirubrobacteraceae bacterium]
MTNESSQVPTKEIGTHMRLTKLTSAAVAAAVAALALAACGGSSSNNNSSAGGGAPANVSGLADVGTSSSQQKGGTLNVVSAEGWEHLDPGQSYFQIDYLAVYATQRPLYSFTPDSPRQAVPDLAAGPPQISSDGKTVTVKIKPNVKWSPPLSRTVTSDDVKYAFERDFNPNVPNGYAGSYYPIVGADKSKGGPISGISTPDTTTIVFHLTSNFGATFAQALSLPGSAAVPRSLASSMDKKNPTTYDSDPTKQAFDGPYMYQSYSSGRSLTLVRNPNWDAKTDFRPAYADKIVWKAGGDANVLARQTLASPNLLMADGPPAPVLKTAYQTKKSQLSIATLGDYYASLNTSVPPFNNLNLRKAAIAAANRQAYLQVRGGKLVGTVATHFLGPEVPGFAEAGGAKGFGLDYLKSPTGDMTVAKKYMKLAGFPSGKYTGNATVTIVGSNSDPGPKEMAIVQSGMQALGFKTVLKPVPQQTMYSKFCGYVKAHITVCPTAGWIEDFPDPYAYLFVPFSGKAIVPVNNVNWAVLNDPKINAAMDSASQVTDPTARNKAWANVDKLITLAAPAIPEIWASNALVKGSQVHGVLDAWNDDWNLSFSSVK